MENKNIHFEYVEVERLIPYARNARIHDDAQVAEIAGAIAEFGFIVPVLIDQSFNLIAGHGRVLAARKLKMEKVPAVIAEHLTESQRRAFILADNKIHDNSTFDYEMLDLEIKDLMSDGFDLSLAGFDTAEVASAEMGDSWDSDIDLGGKDGSNLDGIPAIVKVEVSQGLKEKTKKIIE